MTKIDQVTKRLGRTYRLAKKYEGNLKGDRVEFFEELDRLVMKQTLASQTVHITYRHLGYEGVDTDGIATVDDTYLTLQFIIYLKKFHPLWEFETFSEVEGGWDVLVVENPSFVAKPYVNRTDRMVYTRSIGLGAPSVDLEAMEKQDPKLYKRVTESVTTRVMKTPEELAEDDYEAVQDFLIPAQPTVRLTPPRKATEEELADEA